MIVSKQPKLEKDIESQVSSYAKTKGFLVYKFQSPSNRGVPDKMFISPKGKISFIEFKRKNKVPTKLQYYTIKNIQSRGVEVKIIDDIEDGKAAIDEWL